MNVGTLLIRFEKEVNRIFFKAEDWGSSAKLLQVCFIGDEGERERRIAPRALFWWRRSELAQPSSDL